jgi:hypothetical protein
VFKIKYPKNTANIILSTYPKVKNLYLLSFLYFAILSLNKGYLSKDLIIFICENGNKADLSIEYRRGTKAIIKTVMKK